MEKLEIKVLGKNITAVTCGIASDNADTDLESRLGETTLSREHCLLVVSRNLKNSRRVNRQKCFI